MSPQESSDQLSIPGELQRESSAPISGEVTDAASSPPAPSGSDGSFIAKPDAGDDGTSASATSPAAGASQSTSGPEPSTQEEPFSARNRQISESGAPDVTYATGDGSLPPTPGDSSLPPMPGLSGPSSERVRVERTLPHGGAPQGGRGLDSTPTSCVLCLVGDSLELMMAPGDVLAVKGSGRLTEIGTARGFMGHVLLVLAPPANVIRQSEEGQSLQAVWPSADVEEIWRVRTLESTRSEQGLHEAEMLLYVERNSGQLLLVGELQQDGTLVLTEHEAVELWQSPTELRSQLRMDLMLKVLAEMKANEASWSSVTAMRAAISSARLTAGSSETMETVRACWAREPICTSVVIVFWQRYLCEVCTEGSGDPLDLILKWMPLKADRGLPGDLLGAMRSVGWVTVAQVPRIFRPMVFPGMAAQSPPPPDVTGGGVTAGHVGRHVAREVSGGA